MPAIDMFLQGLQKRGLSLTLTVVNRETRFLLSGEKEKITDRIRQYIQLHRDELLTYLAGHDDQADKYQDDGSHCYACHRSVMVADTTVSPSGLPFCSSCWHARNLAILTEAEHENLEAMIASFAASPCSGCGGHDWLIDPWIPEFEHRRVRGFLICPCLLERWKQADTTRPKIVLADLQTWQPSEHREQGYSTGQPQRQNRVSE